MATSLLATPFAPCLGRLFRLSFPILVFTSSMRSYEGCGDVAEKNGQP